MAMYVDVETSPEALQDDVELMEAVNELVVNISGIAQAEIANEVNEFVAYITKQLDYYLPLLFEYQREPRRLWEDLERLTLFVVLVFAAAWFMGPTTGSTAPPNKPSSPHANLSGSCSMASFPWNANAASSHLNPTSDDDEVDNDDSNNLNVSHEESCHSGDDYPNSTTTDEERFEQVYAQSILRSGYSKLVLPPSCRRIATSSLSHSTTTNRGATASTQHNMPSGTQQSSANKNVSMDQSTAVAISPVSANDDDNPVARLQYYLRQLWVLFRSLLSFDYITAGITLWSWLVGLRKIRRNVNRNDHASQVDNSNAVSNFESDTSSPDPSTHCDITSSNNNDRKPLAEVVAEGQDIKTSNASSEVTSRQPEVASPVPTLQDSCDHAVLCEERNSALDSASDGPQSPSTDLKREAASAKDTRDTIVSPRSATYTVQFAEPAATIPWIKSIPLLTNGRHQSDGSVYFDSPASHGVPAEESCGAGDASDHQENDFVIGNIPLDETKTADWNDTLAQRETAGNTPRTDLTSNGGIDFSSPSRPSPKLLESMRSTSSDGSRRHYFDAAQTRNSLHQMTVDFPVPDKNGYILGDTFLPDSTRYTPLLVFVNSRSGPQQGPLLLAQLRRLLNPIQVWDLADGGPRPILESFMVLSRLRLLVCGGDGTVSWIINTLEEMNIQGRHYPPIAILPLGTGNDLARIHGWGGGYNYESLITILEQISESYSSLLDRWEVVINEGKHKKAKEVKGFFNYLGVGADAQAALQVHYLRESRPDWFFSRIINKAMYGVFGAEDMIKATTVNVRREIKLIADGVEVPLPLDSQGIILLNIDAYAGGVPLWSHGVQVKDFASPRRTRSLSEVDNLSSRLGRFDRVDSADELHNMMSPEERFAHVTACDMPSSCQDGYLDVVSIRGAFHLGQIKVGLSNAQRLCQCREATIVIKNKVAVQVDGEPWRQNTCRLTIKRKKDPAVMLHRSADDGGVETEMSKLLDWAEARNMIDSQVHSILMKEFSRRIESKKRQRRVRQADNIMSTLKKAISSGAMANNVSGSSHGAWQGSGGIAF
jgi:diacylglycerol kinase (ATP)